MGLSSLQRLNALTVELETPFVQGLFDVFAALPDIKTATVLDVLSSTPDVRVTVWSRVKPLLH